MVVALRKEKIMINLIKYSPEFDQLSAQETHDLEKAVRSVEKFIESSAKISDVDYATRDAHAKTYATSKGSLQISEDLPNFITDIFDQKEYEIITRFSNGNLVINKKGRDNSLYGFSIKIRDVKGSDVNYPLVNFPLFPTNSPSIFLNFFRSVNTFLVTKQDNWIVSIMDIPSLLKNSFSLGSSILSFDVIKRISNFIAHRNDFFFSFNYAGIGCYRIGNHVMKIGLKPAKKLADIGKGQPQKESVTEFLALQQSTYSLMIQMCQNETDQPINNLMKTWKNAPGYCLGKITIPQNSVIDSKSPEVENLNFDPFENAENLQPVGKIQQIRKKIYKASIETRNNLNRK